MACNVFDLFWFVEFLLAIISVYCIFGKHAIITTVVLFFVWDNFFSLVSFIRKKKREACHFFIPFSEILKTCINNMAVHALRLPLFV